jgi:hypothetical protein
MRLQNPKSTVILLLVALCFALATIVYMGQVISWAKDELSFCMAEMTRAGALGKVVQVEQGRAVIETGYGWVVIEGPGADRFTEGGCAWHDGRRAFPARCD